MPTSSYSELYFLKLGGSLITDKTKPRTPRYEVIARLAGEIASALNQRPRLRLILGHGSGSFGHVPAKKYGTRLGVSKPEQWQGFIEVWRQAAELNQIVMDKIKAAGLPAVLFPPSSAVTTQNGQVENWNLRPITAALEAGLLPVIYGDVIFDNLLGGTILSTEDLLAYLAGHLTPSRLLLAGLEAGVWADFPECTQLLPAITPASLPETQAALGESAAPDVTGGMLSKVTQCIDLCQRIQELEILIFSGETPGEVERVLLGERAGTRITAVR
jgi:isopentenyl phosphate kinase